jgi:hypothetical protein
MWGPPAPIPTSQRPRPSSHTRGREEAQEKSTSQHNRS